MTRITAQPSALELLEKKLGVTPRTIGDHQFVIAKALRDIDSLTELDLEVLAYFGTPREVQKLFDRRDGNPARRQAVIEALRPKGIVFRSTFLEALNTHAIDLAVKFNVTVQRNTRGTNAWGCQERQKIFCPAVTDEETYATCLHEIGHVVDPNADSRQYAHHFSDDQTWLLSVEGECGAWAWAAKHASQWTVTMQEHLFASLRGYAIGADTAKKQAIAACVQLAAKNISDRPWTPEQVRHKCAELERIPVAALSSQHSAPTVDVEALVARIVDLETSIATLKARPIAKDAGPWKSGQLYGPGDMVSHGGSAWWCSEAHLSGPNINHDAFRLFVRAGRDARDRR